MSHIEQYEEDLLDAATTILRAKGWEPVVIGGVVVERVPGKYCYQLCVGFTANKPPTEPTRPGGQRVTPD